MQLKTMRALYIVASSSINLASVAIHACASDS